MEHSKLVNALEKYTTFNQTETELIAELAREKSYEKRDYFLKAPSVSTQIGFVLSGILRYYYINKSGEEVTALFIKENDFFTDLESFKKQLPSSGFIQALTNVRALIFDTRAHQILGASIPGWNLALKQVAQDRLLEQLEFTRGILDEDALTSYEKFRSTYPSLAARVPDLHLASFLGISKYTLSRVKNKLKKGMPG